MEQSKISPSDVDELALMRLQLSKAGELPEDASPEQVVAGFAALRARQAAADEARRAAVIEAEQARVRAAARTALSRRGVDTSGLDDDQVAVRLREIEAEERAAAERANAQRLAVERRKRGEALFRAAECPARHVANIDKLCGPPQWCRLRDLLAERCMDASGFLVALLGRRGTGKTQLAVSVIHRATSQLLTARYIKALDLFRDFRRPYTPVARGQAGVTESEVAAAWIRPDVLVIDELHQRGESVAEQNALVNMLDRRYDAMRCTILIANQTRDEFAASLGDSVVSRIHETGEAFICDWPSFRQPGMWLQGAGHPRIPSGNGAGARER